MIKATNHIVVTTFFKYYAIWKIKRHFHQIKIDGVYLDKELPLLIISNHFSWWDGFWVNYLNTKLFRRHFHFMMLEEQLKKFSFFKYTGGYSVKKGSREVVESVNYTAQLLSQKENMVMLFPQGSIQNMVVKEMVFESGIETILKRCTTDVQVVFVVNRTEYYSNPKPTWYSTVREYKGSLDTESMQQAYNELYRNCMEPTLTEIE